LVVASLAICLAQTPSKATVDLTGKWEVDIVFPKGNVTNIKIDFTLQQKGSEITGQATAGSPIKGTIDGSNNVALTETADGGLKIVFKGKYVDAKTMQGTVNFAQFGPGNWTAKR
jgi:hypothetical protein